jgi:putative pyruvate formate lyase activating enzyme
MINFDIDKRINDAYEIFNSCHLCPRECGANRNQGIPGYCEMDNGLMISSFYPHFGEEPELVGTNGSGTIFFTGCNLGCCFCQNFEISQLHHGEKYSPEELADIMVSLQNKKCHNINLVTPTHFTPHIIKAFKLAKEKGLIIPIVHNNSGYENVSTLKLFEGIVDIYMSDAKYAESETSYKFAHTPDYPEMNKLAIKEMHRQVGDLVVDENGLAKKGLLIRHLMLPGKIAETEKIAGFIAEEISKDSYFNLMGQYQPNYKASNFPEIYRNVTKEEFKEAAKSAQKAGLHRGF